MRGEVEVYRIIKNQEPELVAKEDNLLVDGAAQTVVDMLTTSPSLSAVASASALLDASNYMVQAISFGKPWQLFSSGARHMSAHYPGSGILTTNILYPNILKSTASATFESGGSGAPENSRILTLTHDRDSSVSSIIYQHLEEIPEPILPTDTRLQQNSTRTYYQNYFNNYLTTLVNGLTTVDDYFGTDFIDSDASSYFLSGDASGDLEPGFNNGQNLNLLALSSVQAAYFQSAIDLAETTSGVAEETTEWDLLNFDGKLLTLSAIDYPSHLIGCYPPSDGIELVLTNTPFGTASTNFYSSKYNNNVPENQIIASSNFNCQGKESMDASGWVNLINPEGVSDTTSVPADGLVVSAQPDGSFSSTGEIVYKVIVSGGDAACASMFGGIWYMGLWTFDNDEILCNGVTPPYSWNNLTNPRRYRLFSKKAFTKDITHHVDNGSNPGLKNLVDNGSLEIIWRIYI